MKIHASLLLLVACGDRTVADEDHGSPPLDVADVADVANDGCPTGSTHCAGECVDLSSDDENCGACGWKCVDPDVFGHCDDHSCPPALSCSPYEASLRTCADVCAALGQSCVEWSTDGRGCNGEEFLYQGDSPDAALKGCEEQSGERDDYASCSDEIPWAVIVDALFFEAVACCCTQEPPP